MKKKTVVIIPIKKKSERIKSKNFIKVNNKKLYEITLDKMQKCNFDEIYVDTDSDEIKEFCLKNNLNFIQRLKRLTKNNANGNDLLNYHAEIIDSDFYFQIFVTAPLLSIKTINNCIKILKSNKNYDSILTINKIYSWFWFNNKPINYKPKILPRSQDAKPIIQETTGLYGIKKEILKKIKCRIGRKPFFYEISNDESIDLDVKRDFVNLENFIKKNKNEKKKF